MERVVCLGTFPGRMKLRTDKQTPMGLGLPPELQQLLPVEVGEVAAGVVAGTPGRTESSQELKLGHLWTE